MASDSMKKSVRHYGNMRDSGVEWLGDIPAHWNVTRIKYAAQLSPTCDIKKLNSDAMITFTPMECIHNGYFDNKSVPLSTIKGTYTPYAEGDIVLAKVTPCFENGNISVMEGLASGYGLGSSELLVLRPYSINKWYLFYYLRNEQFIQRACANMTGTGGLKRIPGTFIQNYPLLLPSPEEQASISKYLNEKCAQIDSLISEIEATIKEYVNWKSSIIYRAVTKGVDPNGEMKDSGFEWIGKVPVNSSATRLKYIVEQIQSGTSVNSGQFPAKDEELGILKTSCVSKYFFNPNENKSINRDEYSRATCSVKKGTIIVSRMNTPELVGACGYVTEDYPNLFLPDRLWQVSFKEGVNVRFVWYFLQSHPTRQYYASLATGTSSSMQNISQAQFLNAPIIMLSETEQRKVVAFLDKKCGQIEQLITEKSMLISDLESYKKSLIYEVVTGKRKVV